MNKILITGGSGFIGTNLIEKFKSTHTILNIDIANPKIRAHNDLHQNIDICNLNEFTTAVQNFQPDLIIHLAARTDLNGVSIEDYKANTIGVQNLLTIAQSLNNLKTVIFASSMYVCYPGYVPKNDTDYMPHTIYGESKVLTEQIVNNHELKPYTWAIIRPTSIWGPHFGEPYLYFFKVLIAKKYFHFGDKSCSKTYGYVENTIFQIESLFQADNEKIHQKTFYLGDYEPYKISEWANEIAENLNFKIPSYPFPVFKAAAKFGDILKIFKIRFPVTSFRLKNMTTDNIIDLSEIKKISPSLPVKRINANVQVLEWINIAQKNNGI